MFFTIPVDISLSILHDWLVDLKDIAALDIAAARSVRSKYLELVAHSAFVLPSVITIDQSKTSRKLVRWINTRRMKLSELEVHASVLKLCAKISFYSLATVRELKVYGDPSDPQDNAFDIEWFEKLLNLLPLLESANMKEFVPTSWEYLVILSSSASMLKSIKLDNSLGTIDGIVHLISAFSASVETLHLGWARKTDSRTLSLLASECKMIKKLTMSCKLNDAQEFVSAFASCSFPLLERLSIYGGSHQIDDDIAIAIFNHHTLLTHCNLTVSRVLPTCVAKILSKSRNIVHFSCNDFMYDVVTAAGPDSGSQPHCELFLGDSQVGSHPSDMYADLLVQISTTCLFPTTHLEICEPWLNNEDLLTAISVLGRDLKSFISVLNGTIDDDSIVQQITLLCPLLEVLHLDSASSITDLALSAIATNCNHITSLSLHEGISISDFGMCSLLSQIGKQLQELFLASCSSLTNATLVSILSLCFNLKELKIYHISLIPVQAIQQHLIAANRLPLLKKLLVGPEYLVHLLSFVIDPANAVDQKWSKMMIQADF